MRLDLGPPSAFLASAQLGLSLPLVGTNTELTPHIIDVGVCVGFRVLLNLLGEFHGAPTLLKQKLEYTQKRYRAVRAGVIHSGQRCVSYSRAVYPPRRDWRFL